MTDLPHESARATAVRRWDEPRHEMFPPPDDLVVRLQARTSFPAVTLLMPTTSAGAMTAEDRATLRGLLDQAQRRLCGGRVPGAADIVADLVEVAEAAVAQPTEGALAVMASRDGFRASVRMPAAVAPRVVIDTSFATRDLVRAMRRTPRHAVLVLGSREARLLEGVGDELRSVGGRFPVAAVHPRRRQPGRPGLARVDAAAFYRDVDAALGAHLGLYPSPIVLAGPPRAVAAFTSVSHHLARLAGVVEADLVRESLMSLAERVRPVLEQYLRSREREALMLLEQQMRAHAAVSGMAAAWLAARHERPEMLVVDESLVFPARLSWDGDLVEPADDVDAPDVVDDLVDELIEFVLRRGGWVAFARPGALEAYGGIALTLRDRRPGRSSAGVAAPARGSNEWRGCLP